MRFGAAEDPAHIAHSALDAAARGNRNAVRAELSKLSERELVALEQAALRLRGCAVTQIVDRQVRRSPLRVAGSRQHEIKEDQPA